MKYTPSRKALGLVAASAVMLAGTVAVTPAGAEVQEQAASGWGKIWKKKLQDKADRRYYTKTQSDTKYAVKGEAYTKGESDARYYSRTDADAKYVAKQRTYRGQYMFSGAGAGALASTHVSFGTTLAAAPVAHFIPSGGAVPAGCSGTAAQPGADPGNLCVFEAVAVNMGPRFVTNLGFTANTATPVGAHLFGSVAAAGSGYAAGTWAMTPGGAAVVSAKGQVDLGPVGRLH